MVRRLLWIPVFSFAVVMLASSAVWACGGLVAPGHAEVLERATTLSAWHAGFEHYVTAFRFAGTASSFGYIVPLPGVPVRIEKGGGWTLERLEREVSPPVPLAQAAAGPVPGRAAVQVLQQVKIDALDITVVRGGGPDVAAWASRNGFDLTPDAPTVLSTYSSAGAVFALAKFDRAEAAGRGLIEGQGQTIQFTIPMRAPWIPLRILALGKNKVEFVDADLFVLTDRAPSLSPEVWDVPGMSLRAYEPASSGLLSDLRSDRGMGWLPANGMWLTALSLHAPAVAVSADLSIDGGGPRIAGGADPASAGGHWAWWVGGAIGVMVAVGLAMLWRSAPASMLPA